MQPDRRQSLQKRTFVQETIEAIESNQDLDKVGDFLQEKLFALSEPDGHRIKSFLNGSWYGHPFHPALTDIPVGAWTAASLFDLGAFLSGSRNLERAASASVSVGIFGALGAALTGLADWMDTQGKPRRLGMVHAGLNSIALVFQIASLAQRRSGTGTGRAFSFAGLAVAGASAYIGGTMVYRHGVGVQQPYQPTLETQPTAPSPNGPYEHAPA